jgi:ferrous iron transport protein B
VTPSPSLEPAKRKEPDAAPPLVVIVGNPNVGKTTLFNRLTGQNARIGNYPGVTVERRSGKVEHDGLSFELVDVPGAYSLSARSVEEQIALAAILGLSGNPRPALCVVVIDAGQIGRNLYLALQLLELGVPLIVAVNMIDEVKDNPPDLVALGKWLGVSCVATDARRGLGSPELLREIGRALSAEPKPRLQLSYPERLLADLTTVGAHLPAEFRATERDPQALSLWALTSIDADDELEGISAGLRQSVLGVRRAANENGRDLDLEIIGSRYAYLDQHLPALFNKVDAHPPKRKASERVDRVLLHPVFGFVAFIAIMLVVFQALFSWSEPAVELIESGMQAFGSLLASVLPEGWLRELVVKGIVGGVGNVVVFLPQIMLLFLFIGLLEDTGYMARVAYLMDRVMKSLGLHGRAFVPMLSGFACAVPAILATRTMERQRDRLLTMMVIPLMTCSARLPVYSLIIAALFPASESFAGFTLQASLLVGMYVFALATTLAAAGILGRTVIRGRRIPLLLELPPYRLPSLGAILRMVWDRASVFLKEAGTVILACTVVLWALLSYPKPPEDTAPAAEAKTAIEYSIGGKLGKAIEPAIEPLGFDWKLGIGMIGAFAAREVFVATMGLVFGIDELDDEAVPLRERMRNERDAAGKPRYTPLTGLSLMVFFALSCQCMSTLAVVRRETKSWRWPAFLFAYMTALAYFASLLVYQGGRLLGF